VESKNIDTSAHCSSTCDVLPPVELGNNLLGHAGSHVMTEHISFSQSAHFQTKLEHKVQLHKCIHIAADTI